MRTLAATTVDVLRDSKRPSCAKADAFATIYSNWRDRGLGFYARIHFHGEDKYVWGDSRKECLTKAGVYARTVLRVKDVRFGDVDLTG